jgi:hypothetical protein
MGSPIKQGRTVAQAVSRRPFTAEARVKVALGQVFSKFFNFPLSISLHRGSPRSYHVGDEQQARLWPQFRDIISPQQQTKHPTLLISGLVFVAWVTQSSNVQIF